MNMKKMCMAAVMVAGGTLGGYAQQAGSVSVKLRGQEVKLSGMLPAVGAEAPDFTGVDGSLADVSLNGFRGKRVVLNIFPSLDTPTCALSVRQFNQMAASLPNTVILAVSMDLPFAQKRFCSVEGIENVVPLSVFRNPEFVERYGVLQVSGPLHGLLARAVVVVGADGKVEYTQLVGEISEEPDYKAVMEALK